MKLRESVQRGLLGGAGLSLAAWLVVFSSHAGARDAPLLPSGPAAVPRFGGYQTKLAFAPEWDAPWRLGPHNDVVVAFPGTPVRLVFWHGAQHVPCWVTPSGKWLSHGAVVREGAGPYHDRLCRFSFAAVQEGHDARVVVRWRYAPVDADGELVNADAVTNWHDWVDECYTIYPDMTGVRTVTLHSSAWDKPFWIQQDISLRHPGAGEEAAPESASRAIPGGALATITAGGASLYQVVAGGREAAAPPSDWGDWPATGAKPPAGHRMHGGCGWKPCAETPTSRSWRMLLGLHMGDAPDPEATGQSWLTPPPLALLGGSCTNHGYASGEKAYVLGMAAGGGDGPLRLEFAASAESPLVNPAIVVKDWGKRRAAVRLNGAHLPQGDALRVGHRRTVRGADLVVWFRAGATTPVTLEILAE